MFPQAGRILSVNVFNLGVIVDMLANGFQWGSGHGDSTTWFDRTSGKRLLPPVMHALTIKASDQHLLDDRKRR